MATPNALRELDQALRQAATGQVDQLATTLGDAAGPSRAGELAAGMLVASGAVLTAPGVAAADSGSAPIEIEILWPGDTLSEASARVGADLQTADTTTPDLVHVGDVLLGCEPGQDLMPVGSTATRFAGEHGMTVTDFQVINPSVTNIDIVEADRCYNVATLTQTVLETQDYTVQRGDSVYEIAHGNTPLMHSIIDLNNLSVRSDGVVLIYPGQLLRVPAVAAPEVSTPTMPALTLEQTWQEQSDLLRQSSLENSVVLPEGEYISNFAQAVSRVTNGAIKPMAVQFSMIAERSSEHFQLGEPLTVPGVDQATIDLAMAWLQTEATIAAQPVLPAEAPVAAAAEATPAVSSSQRVEHQWDIAIDPSGPYASEADVQLFIAKVEAISMELGFAPDYLMAVMAFETGGTFDPAVRNGAGSGATGLIQFMPETARNMGTSVSELAAMSPLEQLDWVRAYFINSAGDLHTLNDVYLKVFFPAAVGQSPDHQLPSWVYRQNSGFDTNDDGRISVGEISSTVQSRLDNAPLIPVEVPELIAEPAHETPVEPVPAVSEETPVAVYHNLVHTDTIRDEEGGFQTVEVGNGIRVRLEHANNWANLISAAAEARYDLSAASSFRSAQEQRELREDNCPDPINSTPSQCTPDTGWVGDEPGSNGRHSDHLEGLAVDLRANGHGLTDWDMPAVIWLQNHAPEFGIQPTVSSEPWHWAVRP